MPFHHLLTPDMSRQQRFTVSKEQVSAHFHIWACASWAREAPCNGGRYRHVRGGRTERAGDDCCQCETTKPGCGKKPTSLEPTWLPGDMKKTQQHCFGALKCCELPLLLWHPTRHRLLGTTSSQCPWLLIPLSQTQCQKAAP